MSSINLIESYELCCRQWHRQRLCHVFVLIDDTEADGHEIVLQISCRSPVLPVSDLDCFNCDLNCCRCDLKLFQNHTGGNWEMWCTAVPQVMMMMS